MVLTEAFAASVPVVASDIPGYRDVLRHQVEGLLVEPGDPSTLADALTELALDERHRHELAAAAHARATRFAWPRVTEDLIEAYQQAIAPAVENRPRRLRSPRVPVREHRLARPAA